MVAFEAPVGGSDGRWLTRALSYESKLAKGDSALSVLRSMRTGMRMESCGERFVEEKQRKMFCFIEAKRKMPGKGRAG